MSTVSPQLPAKTTVLIVEDHALLREGVRQVISLHPDIEVIGEAATGEQALQAIPALQPDVVLLDVNLPDFNGIQVITRLGLPRQQTAFVVLTVYDDMEQIIHAIRAGAAGFCAKDIDPAQLVEIIRRVRQGYYVIGERLYTAEQLFAWVEEKVLAMTGPYVVDPSDHFTPLSKREMEILEYVTRGYSNQEIALQLNISHQTVKNHMTAILRKLDVQDRTQAAVHALQQGWVRIQKSSQRTPASFNADESQSHNQ